MKDAIPLSLGLGDLIFEALKAHPTHPDKRQDGIRWLRVLG
jgi:hypothetical protein